MRRNQIQAFLFFYIISAAAALPANYGIFKSNWNTISINEQFIVKKINEQATKLARDAYEKELAEAQSARNRSYSSGALAVIYRDTPDPAPFKTVYQDVSLHIRSISFKLSGRRFSDNWRNALRGEKEYYCLIKIDAQGFDPLIITSSLPELTFYDENGVRIDVVPQSTLYDSFKGTGVHYSYYDRITGVPVAFELGKFKWRR